MKHLVLAAIAVITPVGAAQAAEVVTYNFTTTSQGYGTHLGQPKTASFDVPLASVLAGVISYSDITNIHLSYDGLNLTNFTPTSIGLDNAAYVNPVTGAPVFHDVNQGLGVVGYQGALFSDSYLSITFDSVAYTPSGQPLTTVADQFNALKDGSSYAGYPTAGYWTAKFPTVVAPPVSSVPEPATWGMMILGMGAVGFAMRRRKNVSTTVQFA